MTKSELCRLVVFIFALGVCAARAQSNGAILATSDFVCAWKLDGQSQGQLKADDSKVVHVSSGQHLIQATSLDGLASFRTVVDVGSGQVLVSIVLKAQHDAKAADADALQHPTWTDQEASLMWTRKDNGRDVDWDAADSYCKNLSLDGFSGWRLPTIREIASVYDRTNIYTHMRGGIAPSTLFLWADMEGNRFVSFSLFDGMQDPNPKPGTFYHMMRTLCVRRP
jgi:hypothetical protein